MISQEHKWELRFSAPVSKLIIVRGCSAPCGRLTQVRRPMVRQALWGCIYFSHKLQVWEYIGFYCIGIPQTESTDFRIGKHSAFTGISILVFCRQRNQPRKTEWFAGRNTTNKWQNQIPNSGLPTPSSLSENLTTVWTHYLQVPESTESQFISIVIPGTPRSLV